MPATKPIIPVILSGGSGTRLWPLSRGERPKQFIALTDERTMFQLTLDRIVGLRNAARPMIVANAAHAGLIGTQGGSDMTIILEPSARNTAPAIALAALAAGDPDDILLVMASDHVIADVAAFHAAIERARPYAEQGWLMTLGIEPESPETGYGYIALGKPLADGIHIVDRFVEKPDLEHATAMLAQGGHVWNASIFLFSARAYLDALAQFQPAMLAAAQSAMADAVHDGAEIRPSAEAFAASPSDSIDYAVMERADKVACAPVSMGWSDVGSWDALHALAIKDDAGNALHGASYAIESAGCLIRSDGPSVTVVGAQDLIVIATADEVLILPRGRSQDVRKAVAAMTERNKS